MTQPHKVTVGRVYYIDASSPYEAMEKAIQRDKSVDINIDALQISVIINPEDD